MAAKDFKKFIYTTHTLEDGKTVLKIRRMNPMAFVEAGVVPDVLFDSTVPEKNRVATLSQKNNMRELYQVAFLKSVVPTPDFIPVDKPEDQLAENEVSVDLLGEFDKAMILTKAIQGGAAEMPRPFQDDSQKQEDAPTPGPNGPAVSPETV